MFYGETDMNLFEPHLHVCTYCLIFEECGIELLNSYGPIVTIYYNVTLCNK